MIYKRQNKKLDNTINKALAAQERLDDLQKLFDDARKASFEKEQTLLAEKEEYQQQVDKIKRDYEELEAFMTKTKDEQVKTLMAQRDESRDNYKQENEELLKTRAELTMAEERIEYIQELLQAIMAPQDKGGGDI